ncbi:MAG: hypothetical protein EZS28_015920 [Streblomastix strix]|uniref:DUF4371 domain-containing protein n=1 Tax=Streblomastix strix TaxID=222440 RepID=A0A5J4W0T2_9EUKA|nr:MAG: hypothetical protein EZS28_015920 [Streblomastix strix]
MGLDEISQDSFKLHWLNQTEVLDKEGNQVFKLNDPIKGGIRNRYSLRSTTNGRAVSYLNIGKISGISKGFNDQMCSRLDSVTTTDFIKCITDQKTTELQLKIKNLKFGVCIDESTDAATLNQFVTFIRYLDENGLPQTSFLDVRPLSSKGATAQNLYEIFIQVSVDHGLNLDDLIGICVDGASAMIGCRNSLRQKLMDRYPLITIVHCCAHRFNLASLDAIKGIEMQPLRTCEAVTQQLWHYFAASPLHASILAAIHSENEEEQI